MRWCHWIWAKCRCRILAARGQEFLARFEKPKSIGSIGPRIEGALDKQFGAGKGKVVRVETVGAKVSKDLKFDAISAITIATILMGVFIAIQFRHVSWSFGTGAVIALVHDVLVVILALISAAWSSTSRPWPHC